MAMRYLCKEAARFRGCRYLRIHRGSRENGDDRRSFRDDTLSPCRRLNSEELVERKETPIVLELK
jgi:hypothetical protein